MRCRGLSPVSLAALASCCTHALGEGTALAGSQAPAALDAVQLPLQRVAFGSCNHQAREQPLWRRVLARDPQLWIWMGDAIYGDYKELKELKTYMPPFPVFREAPPEMLIEKYSQQLENAGYAKLRATVPVIGVWDDHDYGINDGGSAYTYREQSQQIFLDFLGEPPTSPRRRQEGVYASYTMGSGAQAVKFILLDVRYHKDSYASDNGDFLGEAQWHWLQEQLVSSEAAFNVIVSGIQILPHDRFYGGEGWHRFPMARDRLIDLVLQSNARGVILLSGDVHYGEVNQIQCNDYKAVLTEITSSGLTHSWDAAGFFKSLSSFLFRAANAILPWDFRRHRQDYYGFKNFGEIEFDWSTTPLPTATVRVLGEDGQVKLVYSTTAHYLEHGDARAALDCHAIRASGSLAIFVRRFVMIGYVGLMLGGILAALIATAALLFLIFKRSYLLMMDLQRRLFARADYRKLD